MYLSAINPEAIRVHSRILNPEWYFQQVDIKHLLTLKLQISCHRVQVTLLQDLGRFRYYHYFHQVDSTNFLLFQSVPTNKIAGERVIYLLFVYGYFSLSSCLSELSPTTRRWFSILEKSSQSHHFFLFHMLCPPQPPQKA